MAGRLRSEASAYLRQHAENPVDWWPFGDQAFEQARLRDVPVFVSVGYAACHWCHVMAHESFEDQETADYLNEHFVSIKVDREERPDVDAVYMAATQAMTGQGGWPMSVFTLPDGRAFYAGTYYPPRPAPGMPSFGQLLEAVNDAWHQRRSGVEASAAALVEVLEGAADNNRKLMGNLLPFDPDERPTALGLPRPMLDDAVLVLAGEEDPDYGGFGDVPKFPPSSIIQFLLRHAAARPRTEGPASGGDRADRESAAEPALGLAERTLDAMATSALYDQLEGGFARYAVDRQWSVPHFEKMLYDNVQLLRAYAQWAAQSGQAADRDFARAVAAGTADWMIGRLGLPGGGFASSLDADTVIEGRHQEGGTYLWSLDQLREAVGEDAEWVADIMGVGEAGTVTATGSPLHPGRRLDPEGQRRWARIRPALLAVRNRRPQPARDEKVVAGWNGLAIAALAETAGLLGRQDLLAAAAGAAEYVRRVHLDDDGTLLRVSHDGTAGAVQGLLEDYAGFAEGLFALYAATGEDRWYVLAERLVLEAERTFLNEGVLNDSAVKPSQLAAASGPANPADPFETATPSGTNLLAGVLLTYAGYSGSSRHRQLAEQLLQYLGRVAPKVPRVAGWGLAVAEALRAGPVELAVVGEPGPAEELVAAARATGSPGLVIAVRKSSRTPDAREPAQAQDIAQAREPAGAGPELPGYSAERVPLLMGKSAPESGALAYVCRGMVCRRPVATVDELLAELSSGR
ncbi:thioredoxin domain-containing protein [Arthrobacter mangrovi]|uniref:Thioredoxin domain-containing protein n=1 Tax=Arthrobacter mangrovi TaxID=2966350 RepID=A0ABQ5MNW4_9MICC|nr:thioredoxin domain-containing protein [Arthrobacter mangrovi]GLB65641.1 thioredoxin domain-containing protein [Arthrobacter mangrovi]